MAAKRRNPSPARTKAPVAPKRKDPVALKKKDSAAAKRPQSAKAAVADPIYQLKITLRHTTPPVWRRLLVPGTVSLGELNYILQAAMGWTNSHLHQFTVGGEQYSDPRFEVDDVADEMVVTLVEVAPRKGSRFRFTYDFGDDWEHDVAVEKILPVEPAVQYPRCVDGARACPPEDCGGVWGYEELLETIRDPNHEEHESMVEWIGGEFDAEKFDVAVVNRRLHQDVKLFASWK